MKTERIEIKGMSCGHCVMAVQKELNHLPIKVKNVRIGLAEVEYDETKVKHEEIEQAIKKAGYATDLISE